MLRHRLPDGPLLWPQLADESGLVGLGGDLRPERLLEAYRRGIFPWYGEGDPICWWSPDPRAIFEIDDFHMSRRLRRTQRSGRFTWTTNQAFGKVIRACADRPIATSGDHTGGQDGTWITPAMIEAYEVLQRLGHAHSVEAWQDGVLAGGIYGVAIGGLFAGESMFTRRRDGSKAALAFLMTHLRDRGFQLFDIQFVTPHTFRLGAIEIPRAEYLKRLGRALQVIASFQ